MGLRLSHTTIDASDPYRIAEFWRSLVDWTVQDSESYQPGSDECYLESPDGYTVLFMRCPDQKKSRTACISTSCRGPARTATRRCTAPSNSAPPYSMTVAPTSAGSS